MARQQKKHTHIYIYIYPSTKEDGINRVDEQIVKQ